MKLSKTETYFSFALFAICVQVAQTAKEHATEFVAKLRDKLGPEIATVDDAQNGILEVARACTNISILKILTGKPNFHLNAAILRKSLALPEDLVQFPVKTAQLVQDTVSGIPMHFTLTQVFTDELDLVKNFLRSNPRMTTIDFSLALSSFCAALPGIHIAKLGCLDPHIGKFLDLPIRDTSIVETLPVSVPRDEDGFTRIANFFKAMGDDHLISSIERLHSAFHSRIFTEITVADAERIFQALGRKLDSLKRIYSSSESNFLIECSACFLTAQNLLVRIKGLPIVVQVEPKPIKLFVPKFIDRRRPRTVIESIDEPETPKRTKIEPETKPEPKPETKPEPEPEPKTKPKAKKVSKKNFQPSQLRKTRNSRSRKAPERFGH